MKMTTIFSGGPFDCSISNELPQNHEVHVTIMEKWDPEKNHTNQRLMIKRGIYSEVKNDGATRVFEWKNFP